MVVEIVERLLFAFGRWAVLAGTSGEGADCLFRLVVRALDTWGAQGSPRGPERFGAGGESRIPIEATHASVLVCIDRAGCRVTLQIPVELLPDWIVVSSAEVGLLQPVRLQPSDVESDGRAA